MRVLCISDLHAPAHHPDALRFLKSVQKRYKTDCTVCIGDEIDAHGWSRWGKSTAAAGSDAEMDAAIAALKPLARLDTSILFCLGNHTRRAYDRMSEAGVPNRFARPLGEVLDAPSGWVWADRHEIDGVTYFHGEGYNGAQANRLAALDYRKPVVLGHLHGNAGVEYVSTVAGLVWGMSVGCLIDPMSPMFAYGKHHRTKPILGCGVILDGVPTFLPMV